ncbi:protein Frey isoform X1 [Phacochoerus africanus]|uniref:protein Frey isoform X1 n=1 Tax=Phacochoerus africanus TaxID=41426 RepID=UPI001FDA8A40|nr:protein Frey isoform X1 [Phacochoerus africanus]
MAAAPVFWPEPACPSLPQGPVACQLLRGGACWWWAQLSAEQRFKSCTPAFEQKAFLLQERNFGPQPAWGQRWAGDYGVRPKHPWPRGPRPLLSRAQQRKRDGPDMAEYYYDAHL